jgi:hypothetical protein
MTDPEKMEKNRQAVFIANDNTDDQDVSDDWSDQLFLEKSDHISSKIKNQNFDETKGEIDCEDSEEEDGKEFDINGMNFKKKILFEIRLFP